MIFPLLLRMHWQTVKLCHSQGYVNTFAVETETVVVIVDLRPQYK